MQTRLMTKRSIWSAAAAASMLLAGAAHLASLLVCALAAIGGVLAIVRIALGA